jgi:hypothetical protein
LDEALLPIQMFGAVIVMFGLLINVFGARVVQSARTFFG